MCLADTTDISHMRGVIQKTLLIDAIASKAGVRATQGKVIGGHWYLQTPQGLKRSTDLLNSYRAVCGVREAA